MIMNSNEIVEKLRLCKSYGEAGRLLGYDYYNGRVKKNIVEECFCYGVDIESVVESWKNRKVYCLNCGKEITGENRFEKKFCCRSCSATYTNKLKGPKSEETKQRISDGMKVYYKSGNVKTKRLIKNDTTPKVKVKKERAKANDKKFISYKEAIRTGLILNPYDATFKEDKYIMLNRCSERECVVCGQKFRPFLSKSGRLAKTNTCSEECRRIKLGEAGKLGYQSQVDKGTFKGWQSRNILSFPEKFWINVLDNNKIEYVANKPFKGYFLDFYIEIGERKIDLEIDGGQHKLPDRALSDRIRDEVVKESGIEVYRIEWNEVCSDKGKEKMKEKIDMFLKFIR